MRLFYLKVVVEGGVCNAFCQSWIVVNLFNLFMLLTLDFFLYELTRIMGDKWVICLFMSAFWAYGLLVRL